jgi:hypothetical protein
MYLTKNKNNTSDIFISFSKCEELCHKIFCRKCPVNSYDELACRCGRTIIQPPIECGTQPPSCNYQCTRAHACDHPVYHSCHNEDECPPCTHLVSKICVGDHTMRNSVRYLFYFYYLTKDLFYCRFRVI